MKTITYNPETHVLVPREPTRAMCDAALAFDDNKPLNDWGKIVSITYEETYSAMLAAAPQPEPNHNWCAGCSPDNCSGCGAEPVDSEPAMWVMKHIRSGDLAQAKPNQKALHPYMWSDAFPRYTTPQPDRVAELEAAPQPEQVESEPVAWMNTNGAFNHMKKAEQDALHAEAMSKLTEMVRAAQKPQPDRTAELEAALKVAKAALNRAADKFHDYAEIHAAKEASPENDLKVERNLMLSSDMDKALAKINEVLHD